MSDKKRYTALHAILIFSAYATTHGRYVASKFMSDAYFYTTAWRAHFVALGTIA